MNATLSRIVDEDAIGTPLYTAPELFAGSPDSDKATNWWNVGIIMFELMVGKHPFECEGGSYKQVQQICSGTFEFPSTIHLPDEAKHLITCLLATYPSCRIGAEEIKSHPFFSDWMTLNFEDLESKKIMPPWKPAIFHEGKLAAELPMELIDSS